MNIIYWIIFVIWIGIVWLFKKDNKLSFYLAFVLFAVSASLTVFGFRDLAEPVMRVSFIGWIVALSQALIHYKKVNKIS